MESLGIKWEVRSRSSHFIPNGSIVCYFDCCVYWFHNWCNRNAWLISMYHFNWTFVTSFWLDEFDYDSIKYNVIEIHLMYANHRNERGDFTQYNIQTTMYLIPFINSIKTKLDSTKSNFHRFFFFSANQLNYIEYQIKTIDDDWMCRTVLYRIIWREHVMRFIWKLNTF